ncbi:unnamed protein product [Zymoseptoria tritici ST99CH_1A5]|uniref:RRM domain-containing protein n=1 Tax=Zymoseptoria tritici ST99CH_1A5 TaxID=1276529 RepID=A0A1Y6LET4_ZYMTR|nr:unnamed protein product [Zymoseptoria tritici ST99CH_1A5]
MGDLANPPLRSSHPAMYGRSHYIATTASLPQPSFRSDIFSHGPSVNTAHIFSSSPTTERHQTDRVMPSLAASSSDPMSFGFDARPAPAVVIRRLPRNTSAETLRSMLIFAGDLIDTEFIRSPYPEDQGFATAVARFQSSTGAFEAQQKLHGKPNTAKDATMIVETHGGSATSSFERRNTVDGASATSRTPTSSSSSVGSLGGPPGRSRFGSTFHPSEKVSPPLPMSSSGGTGDFPIPESSAHFQNLFSPQSPLTNGHHRISGKSMINDDSVDDETGELLKDPVAYAKSGQQPAMRRSTNPQIPLGRFASMSLSSPNGGHNTGHASGNGYGSPRGTSALHSPVPPMSPTDGPHAGSNGQYMAANYPRPHYPPVNPADQNPPCNTLYVGNLPIDTSEDELKSLFSKQRGYKRLCFRTKQNGPMCFVEFEDTSFATKTLHELYGHPLHNSVKGGIRLSFSKNPLGVRSGQTNGISPHAAMSPQAMAPGLGGMMNGYSSVSGPPPGLGSGMMNGGSYRGPPPITTDSMFSNPFGMASPDFAAQLSPRNTFSGGIPPTLGAGMYGRDSRNHSYADYMPRH